MPVVIDNQTYYRTAEVCRNLGISRNTLFRWLQKGVIGEVGYRDWRGWRLFTVAQVETIKTKTNHITACPLEATVDDWRGELEEESS
jgi:excisionase family DNA binding protein